MGWFYFFCLVGAGKADVRKVILVSRSPRRQALIRVLGYPVEVMEPPDQEGGVEGLSPPEAAMTLAARKVRWAFPLPTGVLAVAADTMVVAGGEVLGKPRSLEEAQAFLRRLSGKWHVVYTGVALAWGQQMRVFYEETAVRFHQLSEAVIEAYLRTGSSLDKAGAYGAQDLIGLIGIAEIRGDFYNVMGLPVQRVYQDGVKLLGSDWLGGGAESLSLG